MEKQIKTETKTPEVMMTSEDIDMNQTTLDTLKGQIADAMAGWTGWQWPHDPGGEVVEGPSAVDDWDAWEADRATRVSPVMASAERYYGQRAQADAERAALRARLALRSLAQRDLHGACMFIEQAAQIEAEYGSGDTYGYVLTALQTAKDNEEKARTHFDG